MPAQAPAIKYKVPISLWLQDHNHLIFSLLIYLKYHPINIEPNIKITTPRQQNVSTKQRLQIQNGALR